MAQHISRRFRYKTAINQLLGTPPSSPTSTQMSDRARIERVSVSQLTSQIFFESSANRNCDNYTFNICRSRHRVNGFHNRRAGSSFVRHLIGCHRRRGHFRRMLATNRLRFCFNCDAVPQVPVIRRPVWRSADRRNKETRPTHTEWLFYLEVYRDDRHHLRHRSSVTLDVCPAQWSGAASSCAEGFRIVQWMLPTFGAVQK
jgi:hypothetical protein